MQYTDKRTEARVFASPQVGEAHGKTFNDAGFINRPDLQDHRRIAEMFFRGCENGEHLDEFSVGWRDNTLVNNVWVYSTHGGRVGKTRKQLVLSEDEYIVRIHLYTRLAKISVVWPFTTHRTRISRIFLLTNYGQAVECGAYAAEDHLTVLAPKDAALLYFSGSSGTAIDALTAHFIPVADF